MSHTNPPAKNPEPGQPAFEVPVPQPAGAPAPTSGEAAPQRAEAQQSTAPTTSKPHAKDPKRAAPAETPPQKPRSAAGVFALVLALSLVIGAFIGWIATFTITGFPLWTAGVGAGFGLLGVLLQMLSKRFSTTKQYSWFDVLGYALSMFGAALALAAVLTVWLL